MDQMMHGKLVMDRWAAEARLETVADGSQQRDPVGHPGKLSRRAHSLLRQAGHGLSSLGDWLERHGELREPARAERLGRSGY